jgi:hypothetical protein
MWKNILIIIVAVCLVALIVLYTTGFFNPPIGCCSYTAKCRAAASSCTLKLATGEFKSTSECVPMCVDACRDADGNDVVANSLPINEENCLTQMTTACHWCSIGNVSGIKSG